MLISLLLALSVQTAPSLEARGIILMVSGRTAYLTPTDSIERKGAIRRATLVEVYPAAVEGWEIVRRDSIVELDCASERIRVLQTQDFDDDDRKRASPLQGGGRWAPLDQGDFPRRILLSMTCSDTNLVIFSHDSLAAEIRRLRARWR
jgi:hypothetical protein